MKAVIMAGGRGTRIAALAGDLPKPMLPLTGVLCWSGSWDPCGSRV